MGLSWSGQFSAAFRAEEIGFLHCSAALRAEPGSFLFAVSPAAGDQRFQIVILSYRQGGRFHTYPRAVPDSHHGLCSSLHPPGCNCGIQALIMAGISICLQCIQAAQDIHPSLHQECTLGGVFIFRYLTQAVIEIQLLQRGQQAVTLRQQGGNLMLLLA